MTGHPYLTKSLRVCRLDFGDLPESALPVALWIRRREVSEEGVATVVTEPAWLVTPAVIATIAYRVDSANATAPPGDAEARGRLQRWFQLVDALAGILERIKGKCYDCYERYMLSGGPPALPQPPRLGVRLSEGARAGLWVPLVTPWDGERWLEVIEEGDA